MKPFDLEKAMAGEPVCMRDGRPVKILDFDFNGKILYKYKDKRYTVNEEWFTLSVDREGNYNKEHGSDDRDLMMADKEAYMNVFKYANKNKEELFGGKIYPTLDDTYKEKEEDCFTDKMWDNQFFCKAKVILIDK